MEPASLQGDQTTFGKGIRTHMPPCTASSKQCGCTCKSLFTNTYMGYCVSVAHWALTNLYGYREATDCMVGYILPP